MLLSNSTLAGLIILSAWFALDFIGVPGLVDREPLFGLAGTMLGLLAALVGAGALRVPFAAAAATFSLFVWAALQIETHWGTYLFFDASAQKLDWYARVFGDNWRFLPQVTGRTTPDGYHSILASLILTNLGLSMRDCVGRRRS